LPGTYSIQRIFVSVFRGEQLERCAEETHRKFRTRYTFWAYPPQAERFDSAFLLTPASDRYSVRKNRTRSALHVGGEIHVAITSMFCTRYIDPVGVAGVSHNRAARGCGRTVACLCGRDRQHELLTAGSNQSRQRQESPGCMVVEIR